MSFAYDRSALMSAAHRAVAAAGKGVYRAVFAKALAREWRLVREAAERLAFNLGLPVGSCAADLPTPGPGSARRPAMRPVFAQFGSARLFFGPNAREAAIADAANRVASSFTRARAAGRCVAWTA